MNLTAFNAISAAKALSGGRAGIASHRASWFTNGLGPTFYQYHKLDLSARTCYATWRSQEKVRRLTWWSAYPQTNLGRQWRKCGMLLLHLQTCWGLQNISCVLLPMPKSLHPSASAGYELGYFRGRRSPQNKLPHHRLRPSLSRGIGGSGWWPHPLAAHYRPHWCMTQGYCCRGNHWCNPSPILLHSSPRSVSLGDLSPLPLHPSLKLKSYQRAWWQCWYNSVERIGR